MNAKDVAQTIPTQNAAEDFTEADEIQVIGHSPGPGSSWG
jgi:hypothetical protein